MLLEHKGWVMFRSRVTKIRLLAGLLVGLAVVAWTDRALADSLEVYNFSFTGPSFALPSGGSSSLTGSGKLITEDVGSDVFMVIGGSIDQLSWPGVSTYKTPPAFDLVTNPNPGSAVYSSDAAFIYDDLLFPSNMDTSTSSKVDYWGLLFQQAGTGAELNLYSQDLFGTPYIYYEKTGLNANLLSFTLTDGGAYTPSSVGGGVPVPLPAAAGMGFAMLLAIGAASGIRKQMSKKTLV